jgi:hypothetical protein
MDTMYKKLFSVSRCSLCRNSLCRYPMLSCTPYLVGPRPTLHVHCQVDCMQGLPCVWSCLGPLVTCGALTGP